MLEDIAKYIGVFSGGVVACKLVLGLWRQQDCKDCRRTLEDLKQVIYGLDEMVKLTGMHKGLSSQLTDKIKEILKIYWRTVPNEK